MTGDPVTAQPVTGHQLEAPAQLVSGPATVPAKAITMTGSQDHPTKTTTNRTGPKIEEMITCEAFIGNTTIHRERKTGKKSFTAANGHPLTS